MTYGSGSSSIATDPNNFITKPFNYYLYQIAACLHELLYYRRSELFLEDVDLSETFNHCTVLLYYAHPNLKHRSSMGMHTDIAYNKHGMYILTQNSQAENTPTVIITIGDSRELK